MSEQAITILLIVISVVFSLSLIGYIVGRYIYRRKHNLPTGDCECCHKGTKKMLKEYHKCCSKE